MAFHSGCALSGRLVVVLQELSGTPTALLVTPPGGVLVEAVEADGAGFAEVVVAVRRLFRVVEQVPLEVLAPALVAGPLEVALQVPQLAFVVAVHDGSTPARKLRFVRGPVPHLVILPASPVRPLPR